MKTYPAYLPDAIDNPVFAVDEELRAAPRFRIPDMPLPAEVAYQIVHDEASLDANPRLDLATFVTSWMDGWADRIMEENRGKNLADRALCPRSAEIERRCVNMLAALWHSSEPPCCTGTSTVGASEACMLGGLSALFRWRHRRIGAGLPADEPNFVVTAACQVAWEKFARLWSVEMRVVPIGGRSLTLDADEAVALCDERTIMVVAVAGSALTGQNDDVAALNSRLGRLNHRTGWNIAIHVDATVAGFVSPFTTPNLRWDFRLDGVCSIGTSGHKYGLVYPGIGWIVWRDAAQLPDEMTFYRRYPGNAAARPTLHFSRPADVVLAQYYQFVRLGFVGYRDIQHNCLRTARRLREGIVRLGFAPISDALPNPVVVWTLRDEVGRKWTLYDLSEALLALGWQLPVYRLPPRLQDTTVMRVVVRQGMGFDLMDDLLADMARCMTLLDRGERPTDSYNASRARRRIVPKVFSHDR